MAAPCTIVTRTGVGTTSELERDAALFNAFEREVWPADPVTPTAAYVAEQLQMPARLQRAHLRAIEPSGGEVVGMVDLVVDPENDSDPDVLEAQLRVHPGHRRKGIGTALLRATGDQARRAGRRRVIARTYSTSPAGEAFALRSGARALSTTVKSHLPLSDVDVTLLRRWEREGPERAPGYMLESWTGPVPAGDVDEFVRLLDVMNDAPHDLADQHLTVAQWREGEALQAGLGHERWIVVARDRDGELVGLHDVAFVPDLPAWAFISMTGVLARHRGHGLGKWMKAAMTLRLIRERPGVEDIRTDNAETNDAMLRLNAQLGYRPYLSTTTWQLDVG